MNQIDTLEILHFPQEKPNGDRSTSLTSCFRYELHARRDNGDSLLLEEADDFDTFHCHVDRQRSDYRELQSRAIALAAFLKIDPPGEFLMEKEEITRVEWTRNMKLK